MAQRQYANPKPPTRREKLAETRRKVRLKRDAREKWIIDKLNQGMSTVDSRREARWKSRCNRLKGLNRQWRLTGRGSLIRRFAPFPRAGRDSRRRTSKKRRGTIRAGRAP